MAISGDLRLEGFDIEDPATCGLLLALRPGSTRAPSVDFSTGTISGSQIGVCIQVEGYDLSRLMNDVVYQDNTTNLDTTSLPLPMLPSP